MRLDGNVASVTGAGNGMGQVATRTFAVQGAKVVVLDLAEPSLAQTVDEAGADFAESILTESGSVTESSDVRRGVAAARDRFGRLNVLYNNAGIVPNEDTSVEETAAETWQRIVDVNVRGVALCCEHGIPALREARGGSIVNIASVVALLGCTVPQDGSTASKGAVLSPTRSLSVQYEREGIRANAICPGRSRRRRWKPSSPPKRRR